MRGDGIKMLPTNSWIPAKANDNRFPVLDSPLPQPIVAIYRDFSTTDPTIDTQDMAMNVLEVGPGNDAVGTSGYTSSLTKSLQATLTQRNVYGALLVDTIFVPSRASIDF
jgi:hypothetical protein